MTAAPPLLEGRDLARSYTPRGRALFARARGAVAAVAGVSLAIHAGETLALVGESGSGKSTLGRLLGRLEPADAGTVRYDGEPVAARGPRMCREVQYVFQDPDGSLNPRLRVGASISEPLAVLGLGDRAQRAQRVAAMLGAVGLEADHGRRFPHELSGGQRQRVAIARALAPAPRLIVADEPVSALDVSVQGQVLNLMTHLQAAHGHAYLLITHDLAVVHAVAGRVAVMLAGRLVEVAPRAALFARPMHPYTRALIDAVPRIGAGKRAPGRAAGTDAPRRHAAAAGCAFSPRCAFATALCHRETPAPRALAAAADHSVACHHAGAWPGGLPTGAGRDAPA